MAAGFQLLTGRLLDKVGYRLPVLIMITTLPIVPFLTAIFSTSVTGLFVTGVLGAMAAWSLATTIPGLVRAVADEAEQGRILGATEFVWSLSMMFGNLIGGRLVDVNAGLPFWIAGFLLLPAIPMAWRLIHSELPRKAVANL
jgi:MFS family permease